MLDAADALIIAVRGDDFDLSYAVTFLLFMIALGQVNSFFSLPFTDLVCMAGLKASPLWIMSESMQLLMLVMEVPAIL